MTNKTFIITMQSINSRQGERPVWLMREMKDMNLAKLEKAMLPMDREALYTTYSLEQILAILTDEMMRS